MIAPAGFDVKVLKSSRRADTYVFLPIEDEYDALPEEFRHTFGEASLVVQFHLTVERELAQADAKVVLETIGQQGFYLQLPPSADADAKQI